MRNKKGQFVKGKPRGFSVKCNQLGGLLHPHHIVNSSQVIESRFNIDNGITLCAECHKDFHYIFGMVNNNLEQIVEYLEEEE